MRARAIASDLAAREAAASSAEDFEAGAREVPHEGFEIKVETQGAMGIENKLTDNDIRQAQIAIFAVDIEVEGRERFNGVKVIQVPLQEALKNPESIFSKIQR